MSTALSEIKRPSVGLIKVVEAIGILMRIPTSMSKSKYKAPTPSNYDETIARLQNDFTGVFSELAFLKSHGVPNDIASLVFAKTLEPGFDYEEAIASGGLATRELFNILILLIQQLQRDKYRIPVKTKSVMLIFDGSLASYAALDTLSHIHNHGNFTILSVKDSTRPESSYSSLADHILSDLSRRCEKQYQKPGYQYQIISLDEHRAGSEGITESILRRIEEGNDDMIVAGIDNSLRIESNLSCLAKSLPYRLSKTVILVKSSAKIMPLALVEMPRRFMVCFKTKDDLEYVFMKTAELLKPLDTVSVVCIHDSRQPRGDYTETRFSLGRRCSWVKGPERAPQPFSSIGWNDSDLAGIRDRAEELLALAQLTGTVRIEEESGFATVAQDLCRIAVEEHADFICLRRGEDKEVTLECMSESKCSVVVIG
jgi:nucleotide-binding universal stress UspA family protein